MSLYDALDGDFRHVYDEDMREIDNPSKGYLFLPQLSHGDWDSSCEVELSNVRVFMERHKMFRGKQWILVHSGGGGVHVGVSLRAGNESILGDVMGLMDYPALDDADCSLVVQEMEEEAWGVWLRQEMLEMMVDFYGADEVTRFDDASLRALFDSIKGEHGYVSGGRYCINLKEVKDSLPKRCPSWIGLVYWHESY